MHHCEEAVGTLQFNGLSFLWVELTNRCNLECVHCYSNSGPYSGSDDKLTEDDYKRVLREALAAGCKAVQFIGGEPTLNKSLSELILHARHLEYSYIEIYSNLIQVSDTLRRTCKESGARLATSIYSYDATVHDRVTNRPGSHARTIKNLVICKQEGIPVRVSFIETEHNRGHWKETEKYLNELDVAELGFDTTRAFGRAARGTNCDLGELCGRCWDKRLCVSASGQVSPCIMSHNWPVGNVMFDSLDAIANSPIAANVRQQIFRVSTASVEECKPDNPDGWPCRPDLTADAPLVDQCKPDNPDGWPCQPDLTADAPLVDQCKPDRGCKPEIGCRPTNISTQGDRANSFLLGSSMLPHREARPLLIESF